MLQNERLSLNALKMCSLGDLVVIRGDYIGSEEIRLVDYEIFSRIPKHQITKTMEKTSHMMRKSKALVRKQRRG